MATPLLPSAEKVRGQIEEAVEAFAEQKGPPPLFLLTGGVGGGKSTLLLKIEESARNQGLTPVHITPPELELDAPAHAVVQAGATLRKAGVNGVLDPVFSADATFEKKVESLVKAAIHHSPLLLFRLPRSWSTPRLETPEKAGVAARGMQLLQRLLEEVIPQCPAVIVQEDMTGWPEAARQRVRHLHIETSSGPIFLRDPGRWGSFLTLARQLEARLGAHATRIAPLTLRLGVALLALGQPLERVREAVRTGFQTTANLLGKEMMHRPHLLQVLRRLSLARFPLSLQAMMLLSEASSLADDERRVVEHTLLLELTDGWVIHPQVRRAAAAWVVSAETSGVKVGIAERAVHEELARLHAAKHGGTAWEGGRTGAVAWMEELFHAACAGDRERVLAHACDVSQLLALGRALSLQNDHLGAVEVYQEALLREQNSSYAAEYLAFNLERSTGPSAEVEGYYQEAVSAEPDNPWWNRRYIRCLLARGKPVAAFDAFLDAQEQFEVTGRSQDEDWLARHFHTGVMKGFLEAGELERAAQVIEALSHDTLAANLRLSDLRNRLMHRQEADLLGGAVFPEYIDFDTRWSLGPHTIRSEAERSTVTAWYPGRVIRTEPQVVLEFAEPPSEGSAAELARTVIIPEEFRKQARLSPQEPLESGQFVEVLQYGDGSSRIGFQRPGPTLRGPATPLRLIVDEKIGSHDG